MGSDPLGAAANRASTDGGRARRRLLTPGAWLLVVGVTTLVLIGCSSGTRKRAAAAGSHPVSRTPTGPATPPGGWSVAYADGFGAPIGRGRARTTRGSPTTAR